MLVFGGAMGWLGWRLLEQDRSLETQRVQERLELAADHVAAGLQRSLSELETYLASFPALARSHRRRGGGAASDRTGRKGLSARPACSTTP